MTGPQLPAAIGRYVVVRFLARGGMGSVYVARDPILGRDVAVKLLRDADDPLLRARFTREAKAAAHLRHRNVITIFDVGEHEGQPFIAMELVDGPTFAELIRTQAPLTLDRKLTLIEDLCAGLAYAHDNGIIHRDVKPANLMIDADDRLKILDFGIARAVEDSSMTQTGHMVGSAGYMSPEQVANGSLDGRSDMFAVGAVSFELLSGRPAFDAPAVAAVLNKVLNEPPPDLRQSCPNLDPRIAAIVEKALAKNPDDRFASLHELRGEIADVRDSLLRKESSAPPRPAATGTIVAPRQAAAPANPPPDATEQRARATVTAARRLFADGNSADALLLLEEFRPASPIVSQAWAELSRDSASSEAPLPAEPAEREPPASPDRQAAVQPPGPPGAPAAGADVSKPAPAPYRAPESTIARQPVAVAVEEPGRRTSPSPRRGFQAPIVLAGAALVLVAVALVVLAPGIFREAVPPPSTPQARAPEPVREAPDPIEPPPAAAPPAADDNEAPTVPASPPVDAAAAARLDRLRGDAERRLRSGDDQGALPLVVEGLALRPDDPALNALADRLLSEARRDAFAARDAAKLPAVNQSLRNEGARALELAQQAQRGGRREAAIRTFWRASRLFASARPAARDEVATVDNTPAPPPVDTPGPRPASVPPSSPPPTEEKEERAAVTPPAAVPTPPPAAPPRATPPAAPASTPSPEAAKEDARRRAANDEKDILATLNQYAQGYRALDAGAVTQVFPSINRAGLARAFGDLRTQEFRILGARVSLEGTRATVVTRVLQSFTPKVGEGSSAERDVEFRLEKSGDRWLIVSRR